MTIIGGLIVGIPRLWDPVRLFYLAIVLFVASTCMISFMFLLMVRVSDPLVPARSLRRLEHTAIFPLRRRVSHRSVPMVAALDFDY